MNHEYVELWYFVKDNWFVLIAGISFFVGWACLIIKAASNGHVSDDCDEHHLSYYQKEQINDDDDANWFDPNYDYLPENIHRSN